MRFIYSESTDNYSDYLFSYQVFLLKEGKDSLDEIYDKGFLPVRSIKGLFYLTRSCRVNLSKFELSSENRRVLKKLAGTDLVVASMKEFSKKKAPVLTREYLTKAATRRIFSSSGNFNYVFSFSDKGIVATLMTSSLIHYAHQFYSNKGLGMAVMTSIVDYAKNSGKKYTYLGTCYGEGALYKTQFEGFEFFDGVGWSGDLEKLKYLVGSDNQLRRKHMLQNEDYLYKFYRVDKLGKLVKKLRNE
jgi:GNAT superfamily N-acetyltransferase